MGPPVTFELKVREQNQVGFWNISIRPTSGASFMKIGRPIFSTSGTLSQTMTLKPISAIMWYTVQGISPSITIVKVGNCSLSFREDPKKL